MNRDRVTIMPRAKNKEGDPEGLVVPGTLLVTRWGTCLWQHPSTEKDSYSILTVPTGTLATVIRAARGDGDFARELVILPNGTLGYVYCNSTKRT